MKLYMVLLISFVLILLNSCARTITKEEAEAIAKDYAYSKVTLKQGETIGIINSAYVDKEWRILMSAGDDRATVVLSKSGKFKRIDYLPGE